ncbi:Leukotriene-B(4) omega-hydroxylase 2 [Seminavis robusta]|uniref:Leukotriene-B(4) omega-hydroxylase 2 n=1 Tax=Seminavis robusta TaxID=568900 RepID=A0A9N8HU38_9STRA|nr:Leukotriene-B(4) omega-hydroxylase 2 [Seminavis robusta]|eukprot:Sro1598_g284940.1 Leukotriene-B(4) omega-hydroxylase 2 (528) ;mRNA; f:17553-19227
MDLLWELVCSGLLLLVSFLYIVWTWIRPFDIDPSLPGPKRAKLVGVTFEEESNQCFDGDSFEWAKWPTLSLELSRRWNFHTWGGPTLNIGFGGAFFNVVSPECLQYILKDNFANYEKGRLTRSFQELMGSAVFTTDGDAWKFHRKITTTVLSRETVKHAAVLLKEKLAIVEHLLVEKEEQVFDFQDLCYKMVFDVFAKLAFGVELNQVNSMLLNNSNNNKQQDDEENQKKMDAFGDAFDRLQLYIHQRFNDPLWEYKQKFVIGERERKVVECQNVIDDFAFGIIRKALEGGGHDKQQQQQQLDVIHQFIAYCRNVDGKDPTEQDLRSFVMTFVLGGRDTTSVTIAWAIFELTKHPAVVSLIRDEVERVLSSSVEPWTYDFVDKLKYTQAVVMEVLRLHCPVPDSFRFAVQDDVLPDGTRIPAKSLVMYSIYSINHSDKVWGTNANTFDPDRFVNKMEPGPTIYPTFNAGPRVCPGKPLALMELKMTVAFLVSKFEFEDASQHSGEFDWKLVLAMKDGFPVKVRRRMA